ncbi:MAG: hypothetical protein QF702_05860 [Prochlorococcaceae cyanobacterium ETNP2_MAG_10]|nr:hypothetical protein [Prochlorococcaceae cyanobacterium ETNP2_MAG_10]
MRSVIRRRSVKTAANKIRQILLKTPPRRGFFMSADTEIPLADDLA